MATYTANYQLHQWVPEDNFLRTDFNQDFQKIDAALAGLEAGKVGPEALEPLKSDIASVRSIANGRARVVVGSYTGDGVYPRQISLGGPVKAVFLAVGFDQFFALSGGECRFNVTPNSTGFRLESSAVATNGAGQRVTYLAVM